MSSLIFFISIEPIIYPEPMKIYATQCRYSIYSYNHAILYTMQYTDRIIHIQYKKLYILNMLMFN